MSKLSKGPKAAADILNALNPEEQRPILDHIKATDSALAQEITNLMLSLDDLKYITASMLSELLRELPAGTFALAMRLAQPETQRHVLSLLPTRLKQDIDPVIHGPAKPKALVLEAYTKTLEVMKAMSSKGKLVLKSGGETLV